MLWSLFPELKIAVQLIFATLIVWFAVAIFKPHTRIARWLCNTYIVAGSACSLIFTFFALLSYIIMNGGSPKQSELNTFIAISMGYIIIPIATAFAAKIVYGTQRKRLALVIGILPYILFAIYARYSYLEQQRIIACLNDPICRPTLEAPKSAPH